MLYWELIILKSPVKSYFFSKDCFLLLFDNIVTQIWDVPLKGEYTCVIRMLGPKEIRELGLGGSADDCGSLGLCMIPYRVGLPSSALFSTLGISPTCLSNSLAVFLPCGSD